MNNELNKNEASRGPLIFTMPATRFLVALNVDWLEGTDWKKIAGGALNGGTGVGRVNQEVVGIHVPLVCSLFGDGIPRRLLRRVSRVKSTSAPSRC